MPYLKVLEATRIVTDFAQEHYWRVIKIDSTNIQRENILSNSFKLFKEKGQTKTTTREIASASGINKGLLYYYYRQKDDIVADMFSDIFTGLVDYIDSNYKDKVKGLTYYAVLNILFFKIMTSTSYFIDILSEIMMNHDLTKIKINKSVDLCYGLIEDSDLSFTEYQLRLATTVAIGAESELLLGIKDGRINMTYDKLATTVNKLFFTMLKINESDIKNINKESKKIVENINIDDVILHLKQNYTWFQG